MSNSIFHQQTSGCAEAAIAPAFYDTPNLEVQAKLGSVAGRIGAKLGSRSLVLADFVVYLVMFTQK